MARRATRSVDAGGVGIGSAFPVSIQTMTNVPLADAGRTLAQVDRCAALGCDLVRVAVPEDLRDGVAPRLGRRDVLGAVERNVAPREGAVLQERAVRPRAVVLVGRADDVFDDLVPGHGSTPSFRRFLGGGPPCGGRRRSGRRR